MDNKKGKRWKMEPLTNPSGLYDFLVKTCQLLIEGPWCLTDWPSQVVRHSRKITQHVLHMLSHVLQLALYGVRDVGAQKLRLDPQH